MSTDVAPHRYQPLTFWDRFADLKRSRCRVCELPQSLHGVSGVVDGWAPARSIGDRTRYPEARFVEATPPHHTPGGGA